MADAWLEPYFKLIQSEATPALWSQGVTLTRGGSAFSASANAARDEWVVHVRVPTRAVAHKVNLWPAAQDWDCDCGGPNPCAHVVAAVIQLRKGALVPGETAAGAAGDALIEYHFRRTPRGLTFERRLRRGSETRPLPPSLTQYLGAAQSSARDRGDVWPVAATKADLHVDQIVRSYAGGALERPRIEALFRDFGADQKIFLDEQPVQIGSEVLTVRAECVDEADGYRVRRVKNPNVVEVLPEGIAVCAGDVLKLVALFDRTSQEAQWIQGEGTFWGPDREELLCREVLPALRKKMFVDIRSVKLPQNLELAPRIEIDSQVEQGALVLVAHLVYGDPPLVKLNPQTYQLVPFDPRQGARLQHIVVRKAAEERTLLARLQSELKLQIGRPTRFAGGDAIEMARKLAPWMPNGGAFERFKPVADELRFDLTATPGRSEGRYRVEADFTTPTSKVAFADALQAWEQGASHVRLLSGEWAALPKDWLAKFGHRIADFLAVRDAEKEIPAARVPEACGLCEETGSEVPERLERMRSLLNHVESVGDAPLPADLRVELRPYQRTGVNWLAFLRRAKLGALLADDMGLGKTLQTLCAIHGRTLVVAPTSVLFNWMAEVKKFRPSLAVEVYHGGARKFPDFAGAPRERVLLTSYGVLRLDAERFAATEWDTIVVDEGQNIKNPDSLAAQAVHRLRGDFKVLLSGTPVENRLEDLWSQMQFLNPGLLGTRKIFVERIARPLESGDADAARQLRTKIKPFLLRRLKKDVAKDLPPRSEIMLRCELVGREREVYDAVYATTKKEVLAQLEGGGNLIQALEAILRLRQACCHPALVPGQSETLAPGALSAKLTTFFEHFEEARAAGHKALVFSQWTSLLDLIQREFETRGHRYLRIDGSTQKRQEVVDEFQSGRSAPAMLISLKAGGVGLTLTAADHVYILDPWWNPAVEDQAADRAHRIGQQNSVLVHRLVARETIEERILELQQRKRDLARSVLEGGPAVSLGREDILGLLAEF